MFTKIGSVSKGKYRIVRTVRTELTSDMTVAREFWRLVGDMPSGIARLLNNCPEVLEAVKTLMVALPKLLDELNNLDDKPTTEKED
jgi:hypothetical protein